MPRAKVLDAKPKGRMSAYAFFVQNCRAEHKLNYPEESVVFSEFSKKCADKWKEIDEKEKQRFFELADKDKTRYVAEMLDYEGPKGSKKKKRQKKDPNAPKRALSAFFWFCNEERPKARENTPNISIGEMAKELAGRWNALNQQQKLKYEEMAKKDKARYEEEMKHFKSSPPPPVVPPFKAENPPQMHQLQLQLQQQQIQQQQQQQMQQNNLMNYAANSSNFASNSNYQPQMNYAMNTNYGAAAAVAAAANPNFMAYQNYAAANANYMSNYAAALPQNSNFNQMQDEDESDENEDDEGTE